MNSQRVCIHATLGLVNTLWASSCVCARGSYGAMVDVLEFVKGGVGYGRTDVFDDQLVLVLTCAGHGLSRPKPFVLRKTTRLYHMLANISLTFGKHSLTLPSGKTFPTLPRPPLTSQIDHGTTISSRIALWSLFVPTRRAWLKMGSHVRCELCKTRPLPSCLARVAPQHCTRASAGLICLS